MARILKNVGESVSGKIGNVVFVQTKHYSYVRKAPDCSKVVWSEQQINYRKRTSQIGKIWRSLKDEMMDEIWKLSDPEMPVFAQFMKFNAPALKIDGTLIDPLLLKISEGPLPMALNLEVSRLDGEPETLFVTWENDPNLRNSRMTDMLIARFYDAVTAKFTRPLETYMERGQEVGAVLFPPEEIMPAPTHVFLYWASDEPASYSNSTGFLIPQE